MNSSNVNIVVCGCVFAFFTFVDSFKGSPLIKILVFFVRFSSTFAPKSVNCFVNSFFVNAAALKSDNTIVIFANGPSFVSFVGDCFVDDCFVSIFASFKNF